MRHYELRILIHTDDDVTWEDVEWGMRTLLYFDEKSDSPQLTNWRIGSIIAEEFTQES